jgi:hypothetical protein
MSRGGKGCYARNELMAKEVHCTISSLSRAISVLVRGGYIERDYSGVRGKRHLTVYRVLHEEASIAQRDNSSPTKARGKANSGGCKSFADADPKNCVNSACNDSQEISLSEEIDSEESEGKNSIEMANRAVRAQSNHTARMCIIERRLRQNTRSVSDYERREMRRFLSRVHQCGSLNESRHALRLIDEIDWPAEEGDPGQWDDT